jgi:hypothetical protein
VLTQLRIRMCSLSKLKIFRGPYCPRLNSDQWYINERNGQRKFQLKRALVIRFYS